MLKFIRNKVQEKKLQELEKSFNRKVPEDIAMNPDVVNLILKYLKDKENDEMPALLFIWNNAGFNDTTVPNCRNGAMGQTQATIIANLVTNGAINYRNMNTLFIFQNGEAIGDWAKTQAGVPNICHQLIRIGACVRSLNSIVGPTILSLQTNLVRPSQVGQLLCANSMLETTSKIIARPIFNTLYSILVLGDSLNSIWLITASILAIT
ncbi:10322_t:CDS:2, partial [Entrophospora sp. SA101]